jgi:uncharacterized protein (TIGR03546 family)
MLILLKALQSLIKTLHSDGTPVQIAAGFALGAVLGLTPLMSLHNLLALAALALLNVSFGAGLLGMLLFTPVGFALDPLFDRMGQWLLSDTSMLRGLWTWLDHTPVLALANFDNTVVLGSVLGWLVLALPIFVLAHAGVIRYRDSVGAWVRNKRLYQTIMASRLYNVYRWFRP